MDRIFRAVVAKRWIIVAIFAAVLAPSIYFAVGVQQDNSLDRLIVPSDPDYINAKAFEKVFGAGAYVVVLVEADDPFAPEVLKRFDAVEQEILKVEHLDTGSLMSVFRRLRGKFDATPEEVAAFKTFATGTPMFKKQGLIGDHHLGLPIILNAATSNAREELLHKVDAILKPVEASPAPLTAVRKVGAPYVDMMLNTLTKTSSYRYFGLFFLFIVIVNVALYRSWRTLLAFVITIGASAAMTVGFVGATGGTFTIVSGLVPMTVLITCMATLVYLHGRFVERPPESNVDDHQIFSLSNKFLACTASIFATAVGFAALAVSKIRPIREMGIWVAVGLVFTFFAVFTLFPALQRILRTPTNARSQAQQNTWFDRLAEALPLWSYRWRWVLVPASLVFSALGAVAIFGLGSAITPMKLQTAALEYIPHESALYKDTLRLEQAVAGLAVTEVWLKGKPGTVTDTDVIGGLDKFQRALEESKDVGSAVGLTSILRTLRYVGGQGDQLPIDEAGLEEATATLEVMLEKEKMLARFVDKDLSQTHFTVIHKTGDYEDFRRLEEMIRQKWKDAQSKVTGLKGYELVVCGLAPLQAKIAHNLVPTLTESFGLTVIVIFLTFFAVFRSGAARIMAMIPSLFAILVMFLFMRGTGIALNVATILIASTVLGTSENDQIHFFYHFQEGKKTGDTAQALTHTLKVAGRAIIFATLINAGGFLAFALADLPSMREFGILSSLAFVLSMIADFTALPAALWIVFREKPQQGQSK